MILKTTLDNPVFKINSHTSQLVGVKFVEGTFHFVSFDALGIIKVWDIRKFDCIQTLSLEGDDDKHKYYPQALTYIPKPLKLALCGRGVFLFEYDKHYNPKSVDDVAVVNVCYRAIDNTVFTPAGNKVKVWNMLNGDIKKIFADITTSEITVFAFDHLKKRCLIGFSDGESAVFNVMNGARVKTLTKHQGEVNFIMEARNLGLIITASSIDYTIRMNSDTEINEAEQIRSITLQDLILTSMTYKYNEKMLITGTRNGVINFWEAETGKCVGTYNVLNEEITSICPLRDLEYILIGTSLGKISLVATPPSPFRFSKVYEFTNYDTEITTSAIYIQDMIWSEEERMLLIADEKCYLKRLDLTVPIEEILEDKKVKSTMKDDRTSIRGHLSPPELSTAPPGVIWVSKAHNETLRAMEYVAAENLIFTSALDKKVKIWNAETGQYIDSLQQIYSRSEPVPIAYKKRNIQGLLAPDLKTRVDKEFTNLSELDQEEYYKQIKAAEKDKERQNADDAYALPHHRASKAEKTIGDLNSGSGTTKDHKGALQDFGGKRTTHHTQNSGRNSPTGNDDSPTRKGFGEMRPLEQWIMINNPTLNRDEVAQELAKEAFDPFYNWEKIDLKEVSNVKSTQWKVNINFERNNEEFKGSIAEVDRIKVTAPS